MLEIFVDALLDTLKLLPVLVPMYIVIEIIERQGLKYFVKPLSSKWSVLAAAGIGVIPQCGFSVVATKLYSKKLIPLGALIAVFISASDEAVPILLSAPLKLLPLLGIKILMAVVAGYFISGVISLKNKGAQCVSTETTNRKDSFNQKDAANNTATAKHHDEFCSFGCHNHEIGACNEKSHKRGIFRDYILHPLTHIATVFAFILLVNLILGIIIDSVGTEKLNNFTNSAGALQPLLAALIGLIPNCASSVAISQMYSVGQLNLGAAVAGLSINAGVSYIVLFKENKNKTRSLLIIAGIFVYSVACGTLIYLIGSIV